LQFGNIQTFAARIVFRDGQDNRAADFLEFSGNHGFQVALSSQVAKFDGEFVQLGQKAVLPFQFVSHSLVLGDWCGDMDDLAHRVLLIQNRRTGYQIGAAQGLNFHFFGLCLTCGKQGCHRAAFYLLLVIRRMKHGKTLLPPQLFRALTRRGCRGPIGMQDVETGIQDQSGTADRLKYTFPVKASVIWPSGVIKRLRAMDTPRCLSVTVGIMKCE